MSRLTAPYAVTPQLLLRAYAIGLFPMAESAEDDQLYWVDPERRAIFPLDTFILSRSLAKTVRQDRFEVSVDRDFDAVIAACAAPARHREKTWINAEIRGLYRELFDLGFAHTVECRKDGELVGGLYGVSLRGAFFGESMFHRERDASKVALTHLVARLRVGGYQLLDTQFITPHLASLGAMEISREAYHRALDEALTTQADFLVWPKEMRVSGAQAIAALED
ncbi:leucyl/phenylalanyl-tRNA--protein transferase [Methylocystis sp. 9N]|uniref:Leucyl/phenylalanyl-tRNA--protein transferase n=1 Tax=Methylocystis borbori TaxID=3118750 RepID=A0ABU7XDH1_9HYPH